MRVVITDLLTGDCELTGRSGVECVRVQMDEATPEIVMLPSELVRLLRFKKKQLSAASSTKSQDKKGPTP